MDGSLLMLNGTLLCVSVWLLCGSVVSVALPPLW
jgi:hypothetical protein